MITIALYQDERDNTPELIEIAWSELVALLTRDTATSCTSITCVGKKCPFKSNASGGKDPGAWSPVIIEGRRSNVNVKAVTALVLDGDAVTDTQLELVAAKVQGSSYVAHTTHRHRSNINANFIRLVLALSRPVLASEWETFYSNAISGLGFTGIFDPRVKDLSRLFFFPTHPSDVLFSFSSDEGEVLDVDKVLAITSPASPSQTPVSSTSSSSDGPNFSEVVERLQTYVRSRAQGDAKQKSQAQIVSRLLAGKPLARPGGNADKTPIEPPADLEPGRGYAIMRLMAILTMYLPANIPDWIYQELFRNSITAMCFGREADRLEMEEQVSEKLRIGRIRREEWDEEALQRNVKAKLWQQTLIDGRIKPRLQSGENESVIDDSWMADLMYGADGDSLLAVPYNVSMILRYHNEIAGSIRWNDYAKRIEINGGAFAAYANMEFDHIVSAIADWLNIRSGVTGVKHADIARRVELIARENKYNPLHDYLLGLQWDGISRIDTLFIRYFGAIDSLYTRLISRRWSLGCVARALPSETWATLDGMEKGAKFDNIVILEAIQGEKKTSAFEVLGGCFHCSAAVTVGDKDSKMLAASNWFIDSSELASFKKAETEKVKDFVTTRTDSYRAPYGRGIIHEPRHCVLTGSTNEDQYLPDPTGNRRYWCVRCGRIDLTALMRDRDQIWAEAVAIFLASKDCDVCKTSTDTVQGQRPRCMDHRWWLDKDEEIIAAIEVGGRQEDEPLEEVIVMWWSAKAIAERPKYLTSTEVAIQALQLTPDKITKPISTRIGHVMKKRLGFEKQQVTDPDTKRRYYRYEATEQLVNMPQTNKPFRVIKGGKDGGSRKE